MTAEMLYGVLVLRLNGAAVGRKHREPLQRCRGERAEYRGLGGVWR